MRKVSVIAITSTYLDITFATTANITSVVETGDYFVRTVICTFIWASFPMSHVDDMRGNRMRAIDADELIGILVDRLIKVSGRYGADSAVAGAVSGAMRLVDVQPTVKPERKNGEWIESGYDHYKAVCGECGEPCATYVMGKPRDKYCKWCGARMNTEDD